MASELPLLNVRVLAIVMALLSTSIYSYILNLRCPYKGKYPVHLTLCFSRRPKPLSSSARMNSRQPAPAAAATFAEAQVVLEGRNHIPWMEDPAENCRLLAAVTVVSFLYFVGLIDRNSVHAFQTVLHICQRRTLRVRLFGRAVRASRSGGGSARD